MKHLPRVLALLTFQIVTFIAMYYINLVLLHKTVNGTDQLLLPLLAAIFLPLLVTVPATTLTNQNSLGWLRLVKDYVIALIVFISLGAIFILLVGTKPTGA